jgi:hypothetical protein
MCASVRVCKKNELAAIVCGDRCDRLRRQEGRHSTLSFDCLRIGDGRNFDWAQKSGLAFHTGVYSTQVTTANNAVCFPAPKRGPGRHFSRAFMD